MRSCAFVVLAGCSGVVGAPMGHAGSGEDGAGASASTDGGPGAPDAPPSGPDPFALDHLHVVTISVEDQYLDQLENDLENRVPCSFEFDGTVLSQVGIRKKGSIGSLASIADKPGFSVKLNEFVSGQRLGPVRRLLLNNAAQDPTFLNEHLGYELAREAGLAAPRTAHAVVSLNGRPLGLYVVKEAINGDFLSQAFGNGDGNLYEGVGGDFATSADAMDLKDEVEEGRTRDDLRAFVDALAGTDDEALPDLLASRLDLPAFLSFYALEAATYHWDGYCFGLNNYYVYHRPTDDRFVLVPHGMDQIFGDPGFDPYSGPAGALCQRVRGVAALDELYRGALGQLWSRWDGAALSARIDQAALVIRTAPTGDERTAADVASFEGYFEAVRAALETRHAALSP